MKNAYVDSDEPLAEALQRARLTKMLRWHAGRDARRWCNRTFGGNEGGGTDKSFFEDLPARHTAPVAPLQACELRGDQSFDGRVICRSVRFQCFFETKIIT